METFCYRYDGSFPGFLCALRDIYQYHEPPELFLPLDDPTPTLYPERWITTGPALAQRVRARLRKRLGNGAFRLLEEGFLTCLPQREVLLYRFIDFAFSVGQNAHLRLEHPAVLALQKGVRHLRWECEKLMGLVRFSDYNGLLAGEISPKNQVLPILQVHFCDRFASQAFLLFDATHGQLLLHRPGQTQLVDAQDFHTPPPGQEELAYRALWRRFYDTIAIEGRYDPKLRQTHMPKRYWKHLTEFQDDSVTPPPGSPAVSPLPEAPPPPEAPPLPASPPVAEHPIPAAEVSA